MEPFAGRSGALAMALALAIGTIALRAPLFDLPLERDEGGYAYIAARLAEGDTPYLDWFDQKAPGIFLAYRLALAWPGDPVIAIRAMGALFCAGAAVAQFALVRALLGSWVAGVVSAALLAFLSSDPMLQGSIANTEIFMVPWILCAALLSLRLFGAARPPLAIPCGVGVLLGIAMAFKQVAAVNAPLLLALYWLRAPSGARLVGTVRCAAAMAAGVFAVWGSIALWFASRGGLAAAFDAILLHNLEYSSELPFAVRAAALAYHVAPLVPSQGVAWILAGIGLVMLALRAGRFPAILLGGFVAANAIGVSASGLYFPHYFQQLLPAVAALAAAAIAGGPAPPLWRIVAGSALAIAPLAATAIAFWSVSPAQAMQRIYPGFYFDAMPGIAAEVAAQTSSDDRVFVFGAEPEILVYSNRISASRYIYLFPVFGAFSDAAQRQADVIAEVEAVRPPAIVWAPLPWFFGRGEQRLAEWTRDYIDAHYRMHAAWVADADGGSRLVRIAPGSDPAAQLAGHEPFAMLFVRATD